MSWSVFAVGRPAAVKKELQRQFANCKPGLINMPHEHASAALTEEMFDAQLNFLIDNSISVAVEVSASGHAWVAGASGETSQQVSFKTIPGFVD